MCKDESFFNDKNASQLYQQEAATITGVEVKFIDEYCKKLIQQSIF